MTRVLAAAEETRALGAAFSGAVEPGVVVYLVGELGAGKTTFAQGVLRGLGFHGRVKSPTFTVVEVYEISRLNLYHFDFYRFEGTQDLRQTGFLEYFTPEAVCLVEWPDRARGLPPADVRIELCIEGDHRIARVSAETEAGERCLKRLQGSLTA